MSDVSDDTTGALAELVPNESDPFDLPFGNKPGEIKTADPEQHRQT